MVWRLRLPASRAGGMSLIPDQGTKIPCATWHGQKKKEKWIIKSDHGSFLLQFLAFRIKAYLVAWLRPFTSTCHSPHQCWTPFTQTTGSGCGCRIQNWETSRQILPLPLSGCDLGQVIFLLWNKFSHLKNENWEKKKKTWGLIIVPPLFRYCDD